MLLKANSNSSVKCWSDGSHQSLSWYWKVSGHRSMAWAWDWAFSMVFPNSSYRGWPWNKK